MAIKNKSVTEKKQNMDLARNEKQIIYRKIEKKLEEAEDIYFGEIALSRINEPKFTSKQVREELGL